MTELTVLDVQDAILLSMAAYSVATPDSLVSALAGMGASAWKPIPTVGGSTVFNNGNADAFAAVKGNTLAISFTGTEDGADILTDIYNGGLTNFSTFYSKFDEFIQSVWTYYQSHAGITKILVTGHSLGGAMVEKFLNQYSEGNVDVVGVTFGSPGIINGVIGFPEPIATLPMSRILRLEHTNDWIVDLTLESPLAISGELDLQVGRPEANIATELGLAEHGKLIYQNTVDRIFGAAFADIVLHNYETLKPIILDDTSKTTNGTAGVDVILGGIGQDNIYGDESTDLLAGGGGSDDLRGQGGNDVLDGGASFDFLYGGLGNDKLYGGDSFDYLYGEQNDDTVYGGAGNDQIYGDIGNDYLKGESDGDTLDGGAGNDIIHGDGENDSISGGSDSDQLYGGTGTDSLYGGTESDVLIGEGGNDTLDGGTGSDTAQFLYDSVYYRVTGGLNAADFQIEALRFEQDIDRLVGIEWLQFANERVSVANYLARFAPGTPTPTPVIDPVAPADPVPPIPAPGPGLPKLYFETQSFGEGNSGSRIVNVLVSLDKAAATDVTFLFTANSVSGLGTATAGSDFDAFYARPVTIAAGQTSVLIPVQIHGDTSVEGNEYFNGMVSNIQGALLGQGGTVDLERITIIDDDSATPTPPPPPPPPPAGPVYVTLRDASVILDESSGGPVTVFEFTVRRTGDLDQTTTVHLAAEGFGAAPADAADFEGGVFPSTTYTFSKGDPAYTFQVRVLGDVTTEANEYFQVKLDALTAGAHVIQANSVGVIMNDDGATLPPPAGGIVYVSVTPLDATKAEGTDVTYDPTDGSYSTNSDTYFYFTISRSGDLSQATTIHYRAQTGWGGTPQASQNDFSATSFSYTFAPGETSHVVRFAVHPDNVNEPDEPFLVEVTKDSSTPNTVILNPIAQGLILNDDGTGANPALITPVQMLVRETEGDQTAMFRVQLDHVMSVDVTMTYDIGGAPTWDYVSTGGEDYVAATGTLTIPAGSLFAEIPVTIKGDLNAEGLEVVSIRLSDPVNGYFGRSVSVWDSGIVVTDNDSSDPFPTTAAEFEAKAIDLGTIAAYDWVDVSAQFDAATPTHVYKITLETPQALMFFSSGSVPNFLFDSTGHLVHMDPAKFDEISIADGFAGGSVFQPGVYFLALEQGITADGATGFSVVGAPADSDPPIVWLTTDYESKGLVNEGGTLIYLNLHLNAAATTDVVVNISYRSLTASEGTDFNPYANQVDRQVIIPAGNQGEGFSIDIANDAAYEGTEQFEVVISNVTGAVLQNRADEQSVIVTIIDNEVNPNPEFDISATQSDRAEGSADGGTFTFTVTRPDAFAADAATVNWSVTGSGVDPTVAADFAGGVLPSGTLSFEAGQTSQVITISANGDRFSEADETFHVVLSGPSAGFGLGVSAATGTIRNDDGISTLVSLPDGTLEIGTSYTLTDLNTNVLLSGGAAADLVGNALANILSGNNAANRLTGLGGSDKLFGYEGADQLNGGDGNDSLYGGAANDTFIGGNGDDLFDGGTGRDFINFGGSAAVSVNLSMTSAQVTGYGTDAFIDIEDVTSGSGHDLLIGTAFGNVLNAGAGNDSLDGGRGNDVINGGAGNDWAIFTGATSAFVNLQVVVAQNTGYGMDRLAGIENIRSGNGGDLLIGDARGNVLDSGAGGDTLTGNDGNDQLNGGLGDDLIDGGAGIDRAYFTEAVAATVDLSLVGAQVTGQGTDTLTGIEYVTSGVGNDRLIGNALANSLSSGAGNDALTGRGGNDTLLGGEGSDNLNGGLGDDLIDGGAGIDRAYYYGTAAATVNLSLARAQITGQGTDRLVSIENLTTGSGNDWLKGNSLANSINAGDGNDTVNGVAGNDTLDGGNGNDRLIGGTGSDTFVFHWALGSTNIDRIVDFSLADDTIQLDSAVFSRLAVGALSTAAFTANTTGHATDALDQIVYETDTGRLFFDADGSGAGARVLFAVLNPGLALTSADFFVV